MTRLFRLALALGLVGVTATIASQAHALPNCGGQNAAPQPVPYDCVLPGKDITAAGVTRHFSAVVHADGVNVTVDFIMSAPVPVDVPILMRAHEGKSGGNGAEIETRGVIPAGQTTATLVDSKPCLEGQIDIKAIYVTINGDNRGAIGGPWIQNGVGCNETPTTTTPVTTAPATSVPPSTAPTSSLPASTVPGSSAPTGGGTSSQQALPATGGDFTSLTMLGVVVFVLGLVGLVVSRVHRDA